MSKTCMVQLYIGYRYTVNRCIRLIMPTGVLAVTSMGAPRTRRPRVPRYAGMGDLWRPSHPYLDRAETMALFMTYTD